MPQLSTHLAARRLAAQLPALPADMKGNQGRERARYAFVTRTLSSLGADATVTGDRAEDWRRVARQLAILWQMGRDEFRVNVSELERSARAAEAEEPAPAGAPTGTGPHGGDLIFPWQATAEDWISVPGGPSGPFDEATMAMPDRKGIARTVVLIDQGHRFHPGGPQLVSVFLESGVLIERLVAVSERAQAREQWAKDHQEWHAR
ncbi:hypothetical protein ACFXKW_32180 [Streptomyces sp. NPDC059193]|uniref:hypothetical protein n=1 Tax=Streptomyces sp. NPDC059193 TaxID=3346763 RepID=UPI00369F76E1